MSFLVSCECQILGLTSTADQLSLELAVYLSNLHALPRLCSGSPRILTALQIFVVCISERLEPVHLCTQNVRLPQ
jgi:hypothetical protein